MSLIIGTDEAGYGPNLGPLVISATVWRTSNAPQQVDLEHALDQLASPDDPKLSIRIADSKQVYTPKSGVGFLESAIFSFLATLGQRPASWRELAQWLIVDTNSVNSAFEWNERYERELPLAVQTDLLAAQCKHVGTFLDKTSFRFHGAASRVIEPCEFNQLCAERGNKATVLTESTLQIVSDLINNHVSDHVGDQIGDTVGQSEEAKILVVCDKHGGRSKYAAVLQSIFDGAIVRVEDERPNCSVYHIDAEGKEIEFRFLAKGERMFPIALASIFSKYLRELAMLSFNEFWAEAVPGIKRTAGYPVDAKRFAEEIAEHAIRLAIPRTSYWRDR